MNSKSQLKLSLLLTLCMLFSPMLYADENAKLLQWVKQTLTTTLSVNYMQTPNDFAVVKNNYTLNAWQGLSQFLGGYMNVIRMNQLSIHPVLEGEPSIVDEGTITSGIFTGIHFWRVNQNVLLPELNTEIFFSLLIVRRAPSQSTPFVIQSMDISKNPL